jgi:diguanylate cyclase (GGDEF)-like protein
MGEKPPAEFRQFQALNNLGSSTSFSTLIEADKLANLALTMAMEFTEASRGYLLLFSPQGRTRYCFGMDLARRASDAAPPEPVLRQMESVRAARRPSRGDNDEARGPFLCAPMIVDQNVVGVLYLDRAPGKPAFEARAERLAEMAAGQLAISITARFLYEQMTEKRQQVELIDKISRAVNSPVDLERVLALVVETAQEALRADGAALLLSDDHGPLQPRFAHAVPDDLLDPARHPIPARLVEAALLQELPQVHPTAADLAAAGGEWAGAQPHAAIAVPVKLTLRDKRIFNERRRSVYSVPFTKVLGVLYLENRVGRREFSEDDAYVLQVFADHITTAVTNDALYQQASTDTLTGLASRRYLDSRLVDEVEFARRTQTPLSVVLLDLDDFKWLNDSHGHQAGDEILRQVGQILRRSVRKFDICGRYGGEEFLLALPETDAPGARVVAENIRERVASEAFLDPDSPVLVTASLGIATFPRHADDLHALVGAADAALYRAKRAGKNRHEVAVETAGHTADPAAT